MRKKTNFNYNDDPCWKGYEMAGMKKKNNKLVPNCVPRKSLREFISYSLD